MSSANFLFVVPEGVSGIAHACFHVCGEVADVELDAAATESTVRELLDASRGQVASAVIGESEDLLDDAETITSALDAAGVDYVGYTQSYSEPSRGVRVEARVYLSVDGVKTSKTLPWRKGEPDFTAATFKAAGFDGAAFDDVASRFLGAGASPRP